MCVWLFAIFPKRSGNGEPRTASAGFDQSNATVGYPTNSACNNKRWATHVLHWSSKPKQKMLHCRWPTRPSRSSQAAAHDPIETTDTAQPMARAGISDSRARGKANGLFLLLFFTCLFSQNISDVGFSFRFKGGRGRDTLGTLGVR